MIDLRPWLPRHKKVKAEQHAKDSWTVHYQGTNVPRDLSEADTQLLIKADAEYHIAKDWSEAPGVQGGSGVMYHYMISPGGVVYITRDEADVLWHCGASGNYTSRAVNVLCGPDDLPTKAQLRSLDGLISGTVYPHSWWSQTACPGNPLRYWLEYGDPEEDLAFKDDPDAQAFKADTDNSILAIKEVLVLLTNKNTGQDLDLAEIDAKLSAIGRAVA